MKSLTATVAALSFLSIGSLALPVPGEAASPPAHLWEIGPIIKGRNYSVNMPLTPEAAQEGPSFVFPGPSARNGHVHYLTFPVRSLEGARRITLRYRIDAAPGAQFVAQEAPNETAILSLYFQRQGDRWSYRTPDHRWYAPNSRVVALRPGVHKVSIPLSDAWIAMSGGDNRTKPSAFSAALKYATRLGFTLGSESGRGHGVYATKPARLTILEYQVE
jgi:hypothetical protein